ncbi:MAG: hypothetical protein H7A33_01845 [Deltaproteobacteria bacterium]|nr:hypothetical protein [Deltaproteobacteria bacterium]
MKTSLNIDDRVFREAKKESLRTKKTLSETISLWARLGLESLKTKRNKTKPKIEFVDLGGDSKIDLTNRKQWMDEIDS